MITSTHPLPVAVPERQPDHSRSPVAAVAALLGAAAAGLFAGAIICYAQGWLPTAWNQLANSGAVWTVAAFAIALTCAGRRWVAVTAGGAALFGEVVGYYAIASPARGIATTNAEHLLWGIAALWIGPAAGLAAWTVRQGDPRWRLVAALAVVGLIAGEGAYEVHRIGYDAFGTAELVTALILGCGCLVSTRAGWASRALAIAAAGLIAVSTYGVYMQTVLT